MINYSHEKLEQLFGGRKIELLAEEDMLGRIAARALCDSFAIDGSFSDAHHWASHAYLRGYLDASQGMRDMVEKLQEEL
jgi:hypothetical protein